MLNVSDAATYSYSSTILGLHLSYYPPDAFVPVHFIAGVSARIVNEKYIGGYGMDGYFRNDNSFVLYTVDFGAGLDYKINDSFRIRCDALFFIPFKEKVILSESGSGASLKIALDYFLNE